MTSAQNPRRPRPTPHAGVPARPSPRPRLDAAEAALQARVDAFMASGHEDDDQPRAPRLRRRLRQDPQLRRRASVAAIGSGVALFVVASLATPLAGAETAAAPKPTRAAQPDRTLPFDAVPAAAAASSAAPVAAPAARKTVTKAPVHVAAKASTNHGVISGLAANGIPKVALNAYRVAAARMANVEPGCGIDWAMLAGIGREESDHGRFGGATLHADGVSTPAIVGPALDGVHWDYIPVSADYERITGDSQFAHALGPMQFIPTTWAAYGADADGDGTANIFDINDAALGTARYLCAAGGDLRTHAGQVAGVLAYNHSDQYLAQVLALADAYRSGLKVTGIPVGITTGALPRITHTGYIPPANPGAPTAAGRTPAEKAAAAKAAAKAAAARTAAAKAAAARARAAQQSTSAHRTTGSTPTRTTTGTPSTGHSGATSSSPTGTGSGSSGGGSSSSAPTTPAPTTPAPSASSSPKPSPSRTCHLALGGLCI